MASTVDQIIAKFQRRYPDCDSTTALGFFQDALRRVVMRIPIRNLVVYIPQVAQQAEYDLDEGVFQIHSAYYQQGVNSSYQLWEKSTDEKDVLDQDWRATAAQGGPWQYYIQTRAADAGGGDTNLSSAQNVIGFYPTPVTTTGATYPRVALYATGYKPLSGSMTVPSNLIDDNVFVYRMFEFWAEYVGDPGLAQYWNGLAEKQMDINNVHIQDIQNQGQSGIMLMSSFYPTRTR